VKCAGFAMLSALVSSTISPAQALAGDLEAITKAAHAAGAYAGFDLAHAAGNVPLELHKWDVDFATWCSYKYLNSGPGSIGGAFMHEKFAHDNTLKRFAGWWGHDLSSRFGMEADFQPIPGAFGFRLSNPPILCVVSLLASLELFEKAGGMKQLREKSFLLTGFLEYLLRKYFSDTLEIITPNDISQRGCQLSVIFKANRLSSEELTHSRDVVVNDLSERLKTLGVICDVRRGKSMRIAPVPLYNSFVDVWRFVRRLKEALNT